jgi:hypothetical protein
LPFFHFHKYEPIQNATRFGITEMIEFLLDQGANADADADADADANADARMVDGKTPLGETISGWDEEVKVSGRVVMM